MKKLNKSQEVCEIRDRSEINYNKSTVSNNRLFSGVVLLGDEGTAFYKRAVGKQSLTTLQSIDSVFEISSISKSFTATAVMMLVEQNRLHLEEDIERFFPTLPYKNITIKNLLNHTSGLPDYMAWFENPENWDQNKIVSNEDVLFYLENQKPKVLFQANAQWEYCNTGYVLLAVYLASKKCMKWQLKMYATCTSYLLV
ncbi:serine hydrolase domain-containing protein [Litchfieldia alkalitelluris]|uniref:serine hydrolase domain-containing protein n=1 Tax=Litchfieldia alkalitelluris TaxID=304268 RepID=UPI000B4548CE|nr:serine hydrolase domain-containing protein [Litchfieldia alkalitelluris]